MSPRRPVRAHLTPWHRSIALAASLGLGCGGSTEVADAAASAVQCVNSNIMPQAGTNACTTRWTECTGGMSYEIQCTPSAGGFTCSCYRDALLTGSFVTCAVCANTNSSDKSIVNSGCGWNLYSFPSTPPRCSSVDARDAGVDAPSSCRGLGATCTGTCCPGLTCVGFSGFRPGTCE